MISDSIHVMSITAIRYIAIGRYTLNKNTLKTLIKLTELKKSNL